MKKQNRRTFVATTLGLTATAAAAGTPFAAQKPKKQLAHHVFFWLKNRDSKEDLEKLLAGIKSLEKIDSVRKLYVGVPAQTEVRPIVDASYSASELIFFDDIAGHNAYQVHPIHKKFVEECVPLVEKVVVYDAMDI